MRMKGRAVEGLEKMPVGRKQLSEQEKHSHHSHDMLN